MTLSVISRGRTFEGGRRGLYPCSAPWFSAIFEDKFCRKVCFMKLRLLVLRKYLLFLSSFAAQLSFDVVNNPFILYSRNVLLYNLYFLNFNVSFISRECD